MKKLSLLSCVVSLTIGIALVVLSAKAESATLFGWKRSTVGGGLVSIDTETAEVTLIIEASDRQIEGLAFDSTTETLYGVEQKWGIEENVLVEINLNNGTVSDIGPVGFNEVTAMAFDETTYTIFALDQTTRTLLEIDPSTGESIDIGNFSQAASNGLAAQPITGDLFAAVLVDPGYLARIDKATGESTLVGSFGDCHVSALSFHPDTGVLFGKAGGPSGGQFADGRLVAIDLTSGLATPIGVAIGPIVALAFAELPAAKIKVGIDIKPRSCPNPLNVKSKGALPVAILGTEELDVYDIDVTTVSIDGVAPIKQHFEDVATPFNGASTDNCFDCTEQGPDGFVDLVLHFDTREIVAMLGDVNDGDCLELELTGALYDGSPIVGKDCILVLSKGGKGKSKEPEPCYGGVPKTGQTTNWLDGDDGDLQMGVPWLDPRFTDKLDGTVIDTLTGLTWTQNANLYGQVALSAALTSCSSCTEGGYTDWRLPNVRELESLIDYGGPQYSKLPTGHPFTAPSGPWYFYWSSTSQGLTSAFCISFENGFVWSMGGSNHVWCVRGGN